MSGFRVKSGVEDGLRKLVHDDARNVEPDDDLNVACKEILKVWGLGSSCRT